MSSRIKEQKDETPSTKTLFFTRWTWTGNPGPFFVFSFENSLFHLFENNWSIIIDKGNGIPYNKGIAKREAMEKLLKNADISFSPYLNLFYFFVHVRSSGWKTDEHPQHLASGAFFPWDDVEAAAPYGLAFGAGLFLYPEGGYHDTH